ncbi:TPA: exopolysaccharide biosynthesis polyprenyl glycosylphosphotransferase, partial [Streptococcus pneumoniae]
KVLDKLLESDELSWKLVAVSVLDKSDFQHDKIPVIEKEKIIEFATHEVVDEVFVNLPGESYDIGEIISRFETMGIDVTVNLKAFDKNLGRNKQIHEMVGLNVVTFSTNFYKTSHVIAKRIIDVMGALVGLILCGLVSIVLVPLIRKDGGSAIFAQTRIGKNGRQFTFYKFRSMCVDAEAKKRELMEQNTMQGGMFKVDDDPRITKIGRFIRKTSLDELPQFYNVLKGDMSLVGTRPPTVDEYVQYTSEQKRRLSFKPGITGLWQVSGRSKITDFDDVVKLDVAYIDNWTIWKDIEILLKTVKVVFMRDYPNLIVIGHRNGYFSEEDEQAIQEDIREKNPDFVFIGITSPKKEYIIQKFMDSGVNSVFMGVGGSFDVLSGHIQRAPLWMQKSNLEWLFRVANEPKRLFKRYFVGNISFIGKVLKAKRGVKY